MVQGVMAVSPRPLPLLYVEGSLAMGSVTMQRVALCTPHTSITVKPSVNMAVKVLQQNILIVNKVSDSYSFISRREWFSVQAFTLFFFTFQK